MDHADAEVGSERSQRMPNGQVFLDVCSLITYTIMVSSILYFQRYTTGAALTSSKYR